MTGGISTLPDEILLHIFSQLPVHSIRCVLPLVCKTWSRLAFCRNLWKTKTVALKKGQCFSNGDAFLAFLSATPCVSKIALPQGYVSQVGLSLSHKKLYSL